MTHRTILVGLLISLSAVAATAVATAGGGVQVVPPAPQRLPVNGVSKDAVDVVFFSGKQPLLLRLHVNIDGKTVREYRNAYVKQWFDHLDRDGNGWLSPAEAALAPSPQMLQQLRQNGTIFNIPKKQFPTFAALDTNKDGKVSLDELIAYFENAGFHALELSGGQVQQTASSLASKVLFENLELTKAALGTKEKSFAMADALMKRFDLNDDETISQQELLGVRPLPPGPGIQPVRLGERLKPNAQVPFHLITPADNPETVALLLLRNYRKAGSGVLTAADCDLGPGVFASLDVNKDGKLELAELEKWQERPPDLEFTLRLGRNGPQEMPVDLFQPGGKKAALANKVTRTADGVLSLAVDDSQLSFGPVNDGGRFATSVALFRGSVGQLFRARLDPKKGFVTLDDLDGPQFQLLRQLFLLLDRDGDGKLTEKEVQAFNQLENGASSSAVLLNVQDHGRALFQLLDLNRDGRLSLRELRTAWERLAPLDKNGDGVITPDEITRQFHLSASVGLPNGRFFVGGGTGGMARETPRSKTAVGPMWFRKMDIHGIGDVSFRNFLGTRADFDRIDTDGDGLISGEEAIRFDALMRKQGNKR